MTRARRNLLISAAVALLSDLWPIPGMLLAALVFREGIHSGHPDAYLGLTLVLNFALFFGLTYLVLSNFWPSPKHSKPEPQGPVKGIIYTQSELDEFKRHGF